MQKKVQSAGCLLVVRVQGVVVLQLGCDEPEIRVLRAPLALRGQEHALSLSRVFGVWIAVVGVLEGGRGETFEPWRVVGSTGSRFDRKQKSLSRCVSSAGQGRSGPGFLLNVGTVPHRQDSHAYPARLVTPSTFCDIHRAHQDKPTTANGHPSHSHLHGHVERELLLYASITHINLHK